MRVWEEQKAQERAAAQARSSATGAGTVLAGVPRALPALTRAAKLGRRAARVGFDWPDARAVRAKVLEEIHEVDDALASATGPAERAPGSQELSGELGDLLFTVVNWSRHLHIDAEAALRAANDKFERRFAHMESLAQARQLELAQLSAAEWDALWCEAKLNAG
jgi:MazG family protein